MDRTRLEKTKVILEDARGICDKLDMIIVEDGLIDDDELALMKVIREHILGYDKLLEDILADGVIDEDELRQMNQYEMHITEAIQHQISADGIISNAENEMVNMLFDCFKSLNSLRNY